MKSRRIPFALVMSVALLLACSGIDFLVRGMWYPTSFAVTLGDVDGDGDFDAFVANGHTDDTGEDNTIWLNDGTGHFADTGQRLGDPCCNSNDSRAVSLGDLDSDGDLDAFVGNYNGYNAVWLNDGKGNFVSSGQTLIREQGANSWPAMNSIAVALGDLDADGDLDAFVGNCCRVTGGSATDRQGVGNYGANKVWLNDGDGTLTNSGQSLGSAATEVVALKDLDGDGDLDAFVGNSTSVEFWWNDGRGKFSDGGQHLEVLENHVVALGDVDGDGAPDVFAGSFDQGYQVWHNDGVGPFGQDSRRQTILYWLVGGSVVALGLGVLLLVVFRQRPHNQRICDPFTRNRTTRRKLPDVRRMGG